MKAKLLFDLPTDRDDFTLATHASDYWLALWDFNQYITAIVNGKREEPTVDEMCIEWATVLEERGVDVYEIS